MSTTVNKTSFNVLKGLLIVISTYCTGLYSQNTFEVNAFNSPFYIMNDTTIEYQDTFKMGAGAKIFIANHVNIDVKGYLLIQGSINDRAFIKPINPGIGWGEFKIYNGVDSLIIEHAVIEDGRVLSFNTNNYYNNVIFINNQTLACNDAISRFIKGKLFVSNCKVYGTNRGKLFFVTA